VNNFSVSGSNGVDACATWNKIGNAIPARRQLAVGVALSEARGIMLDNVGCALRANARNDSRLLLRFAHWARRLLHTARPLLINIRISITPTASMQLSP